MPLKSLFIAFCMVLTLSANANDLAGTDENFMLVLREVEGANKQEFGLVPSGPNTAVLGSGGLMPCHSVELSASARLLRLMSETDD